jgi:hypothetical protein
VTETFNDVGYTATHLESLVHNETIFSSTVAAVILTAYDVWMGAPLTLPDFIAHEMTALGIGTLSGAAVNMVPTSNPMDQFIAKGASAAFFRLVEEVLLQYSNSKSIAWQDVLVLSAVTGVSFGIGSALYFNPKSQSASGTFHQ